MRRSTVRLAEIDAAIAAIISKLERLSPIVDWADGGAVYTQLKDWLDKNKDEESLHILTLREMERYDRARRPTPQKTADQGTLFTPDALLPLGNAARVRMALAQRDHLDRWEEVLDEEFNASVSAYWKTKGWIEERRSALRSSSQTLLDLEIEQFGYLAPTVDESEMEEQELAAT